MSSEPRELKIGLPPIFDGDRRKANRWILSVRTYFLINKKVYDDDMKKVSFALSYMTEGVAGNWVESIYQDSLELDSKGDEKGLPTWEDFQKLFLSAFNPVNVGLEARNELRNLKQTGEADDYITRFRVLIGQSGIQEDISRI